MYQVQKTQLMGQERLTRMVHVQRNSTYLHGIAFPWVHTTLFNTKLRQVIEEATRDM